MLITEVHEEVHSPLSRILMACECESKSPCTARMPASLIVALSQLIAAAVPVAQLQSVARFE